MTQGTISERKRHVWLSLGKSGTSFKDFSPTGVSHDALNSSNSKSDTALLAVPNQGSLLKTQCPGFLEAGHVGTLFLALKFQTPRRKARIQDKPSFFAQFRKSELFFTVLGKVGTLHLEIQVPRH